MKKTITKKNIGVRLDVFLSENQTETRSQLAKLITAGNVTINGAVAKAGHKLRLGDIVEFSKTEKKTEPKNKKAVEKKTDAKIIPAEKFQLEIIAITDDYLVVNKPAGLIVHRAPHFSKDIVCLTDLLLKKYPKLKSVGEDPLRPGIVHRLDREVSGLMVVARNADFFRTLKKQFQTHKVLKEYSVLVYGSIAKNSLEINFPIKRISQGYKMASVPQSYLSPTDETREAITRLEVEKRYINYTLLGVRILTGRTHQIRVHMFAYGHPVVGDDLYSTKKTREKNQKFGLSRIFLVSRRLGFQDASGKYQEFNIDLPTELQKFIDDNIR